MPSKPEVRTNVAQTCDWFFLGDQRLLHALPEQLPVRGHIGGQGVEGGDIGFLEGHCALAGEAHHQHDETILGHLDHAAQFALLVHVFNRHKIVPVEFRRTLQIVVGAQHVLVAFVKVPRHAISRSSALAQ